MLNKKIKLEYAEVWDRNILLAKRSLGKDSVTDKNVITMATGESMASRKMRRRTVPWRSRSGVRLESSETVLKRKMKTLPAYKLRTWSLQSVVCYLVLF